MDTSNRWKTFSFRLLPRCIRALLAAAIILATCVGMAQDAITLTAAFTFDSSNGGSPCATLVHGPDGALYSTCRGGPGNAVGSVYRFTPDGGFSNLCCFYGTNGASPGEIVFGRDGNIYGVAEMAGLYTESHGWGPGTIFKLTPDGTLTTLFFFAGTNGYYPRGWLAEGPDGNLYGTTARGGIGFSGDLTGNGTVFRITPQGVLTTLVFFDRTNGCNPDFGLVLGRDGDLYGQASAWSALTGAPYGMVFKMTPQGTLTSLPTFDGTNSFAPTFGLTVAADGDLYGAGLGLYDNAGKLFKVTTNGVVTILHRFSAPWQAARRLTQGTDGCFYGVSDAWPSPAEVFRMAPDGAYTTLASFNGPNGSAPTIGSIMQASSGDFYGATEFGGTGWGVIYRLHVPGSDAPKIQAITQSANGVGLSWVGLPGRSYQLQWKTGLDQSQWNSVGEAVRPTNSIAAAFDPTAAPGRGFYRVALLP